MPMGSDRDISKEIQQRRKEINPEDWGPWKINSVDEYGDLEFWADRLKRKGKYSALSLLQTARNHLINFVETTLQISHENIRSAQAERFGEWLISEVGPNVQPSTASDYIGSLSSMTKWYTKHDYYDGDPFDDIEYDTDEIANDAGMMYFKRIDVPMSDIANSMKKYGLLAPGCLMMILILKTGARISEIVNMNKKDIHLNHEVWNITPRSEIKNKPDTIYIPQDVGPSKMEANPDIYGNKRKNPVAIPIDDELKKILIRLAVTEPPLMTGDQGSEPIITNNNAERYTTAAASDRVVKWSKESGFHGSDDELENVTPHWGRAEFSRQLYVGLSQDDLGGFGVQKFVKGLRGDSGTDVIDEYIGALEEYRSPIIRELPKLGIKWGK